MSTTDPNIISPTSAKLAAVTELHAEVFNADELSILHTSVVELQDYERLMAPPEGVAPGPPVNVDVPYTSQVGNVLNCTMGNWQGEPDSYTYQWRIDDTDVPSDGMDLPVAAGDIGHVATCVVTAHNTAGSTEAPPSNPVTIT